MVDIPPECLKQLQETTVFMQTEVVLAVMRQVDFMKLLLFVTQS